VYNFPPLIDCRSHFEAVMGMKGKIDWATGEAIE
jgi:hypothetical protein